MSMTDGVFQICGATVPPMIGRKGLMARLMRDLTKPNPDHLQVVGPRFGGKTVLLHELAHRMATDDSPFSAVFFWDLGHLTPDSNEAFLHGFRDHLADALAEHHPKYAGYLRNATDSPYSDIAEVLDSLKQDKQRVLAILDGFDKPLANGRLTRNLWDQLRELASRPSLRLVTASRRRLYELIRSPDSQTSDFWNIFNPSAAFVGCFAAEDLDEALERLNGHTLTAGARTELWNWTNGYPPLLLSILNGLTRHGSGKQIDAAMLNAVAEQIAVDVEGLLGQMWSDCSESAKDLWREIRETERVEGAGEAASQLAERGFASRDGPLLGKASRFLDRYLQRSPDDSSSVQRLFGTAERFHENARALLERRIKHIEGIDPRLKRYIERAIEDIPDQPDDCLRNVRGVVDRTLELIWDIEFPERRIPASCFAAWVSAGERLGQWKGDFPTGRGHQIRVLQLLTGTEKSPSSARRITRNTYVLANAAQGFADYGQHLDGVPVTPGTAIAAINVCIELAASVTRETFREG
jgi:hypothetical protein